MRTYRIAIRMDTNAFTEDEGEEVARILHHLAEDCEDEGIATDAMLHDANGKLIGTAKRSLE